MNLYKEKKTLENNYKTFIETDFLHENIVSQLHCRLKVD